MEYTIIEKTGKQDFLFSCREAIKQGWVPQGGISIAISPACEHYYAQSFIKMPKAEV